MKRILMVAFGAGLCFFILRLITFAVPEIICIWSSVVLAIALLVILGIAAKEGITKWRKISNMWLVPATLCLVFLISGFEGGPRLGRKISDWMFMKHIAAYAGIVSNFKSGGLSCATSCIGKVGSINAVSLPANVRDILGARCDDGGAIVLFRVKTDVPLLHEGYFFKDYGQTSNCGLSSISPETGWPHAPYTRHVEGYWYHFSDQPGL